MFKKLFFQQKEKGGSQKHGKQHSETPRSSSDKISKKDDKHSKQDNKSVNDKNSQSGNINANASQGNNSQQDPNRPMQTQQKPLQADKQQSSEIRQNKTTERQNTVTERLSQSRLTEEALQKVYSERLPELSQVPEEDRQNLFVKKLYLCSFTFDMADPKKHSQEKEVKRLTLLELVEYVSSGSQRFTESVLEDIVFMLKCNLFRTLPPPRPSESESLEPEEEEPLLEPAWPHLTSVYDLLLRLVVSNEIDAKTARKYIDTNFVLHLLELFDSEDPRERDFLKTILHRIYGKIMQHRSFIRKAINNVFYRFVFETERHNGIAELLEILGSIINGFAVPLKEEHKTSLLKALMPLHKPKSIGLYHQQLCYCVTQFIEKDQKLADPVIKLLLRYWPIINSQKELLFMGELEEILELTQLPEFQSIYETVFKQIAKSLQSQHFQVAERALLVLNNERILGMIQGHRLAVVPLLLPALEVNQNHWNHQVYINTMEIKKIFIDFDEDLYEKCRLEYEQRVNDEKEREEQRKKQWIEIEKNCSTKNSNNSINSKTPTNGYSAQSSPTRSKKALIS